ncbi:MAG: D-alanyl-D-alanine carboxypeptidase/D-alanyl-D-alanine-endopeptidase [Pseudomonadota bacterium]
MPQTVSEAFKRVAIPPAAVGTYVQEVNTQGAPIHRPLIVANDTLAFNPASTMKLVTGAAALDLLSPAYTWKTRAFASGPQAGDVLYGDLIFKGGGDPKLVMENFWLFLRQIRSQGVREIRGNLVLDRSVFAGEAIDPARFDGDPAKPYNANADALLLGYKAITLRFKPDLASNTALMTADAPLDGVALVAPALSGEECGAWQGKLQLVVTPTQIGFNGKMPAACGEKSWSIHPYGMTQTQYFGAVFRQLWRDLGGSLQGQVIDGVLPADARLLAERESVALPEVLRDMNKFSNNVIARHLLLTIATEVGRMPGTPERGAHAVKSWLAAKGIDNPEVVIENGAGLSRIERISAGTLGRMLVTAYRSPTMPEFVSSLPIAGVDGTMRRRVQGRSVLGYAHIKTGSLEEVRTMAGYVQAASGRRYAVVNLINHANASAGQEAQDLLLQWIYDNG